MSSTLTIEKEEIDHLEFSEVHLPSSEREAIQKKLFEAMMLGNIDHHKVKIHFMTPNGIKEVETTIWATTDKFILLKGGRYIPVASILSVS